MTIENLMVTVGDLITDVNPVTVEGLLTVEDLVIVGDLVTV